MAATTGIISGGAICGPAPVIVLARRMPCSSCGGCRIILKECYEWYPASYTCLYCGREWSSDGEVRGYWRKRGAPVRINAAIRARRRAGHYRDAGILKADWPLPANLIVRQP